MPRFLAGEEYDLVHAPVAAAIVGAKAPAVGRRDDGGAGVGGGHGGEIDALGDWNP
jgi:hypothetical protein